MATISSITDLVNAVSLDASVEQKLADLTLGGLVELERLPLLKQLYLL